MALEKELDQLMNLAKKYNIKVGKDDSKPTDSEDASDILSPDTSDEDTPSDTEPEIPEDEPEI